MTSAGRVNDPTLVLQVLGPAVAPCPAILVTTAQDVNNPADGETSLREAIAEAGQATYLVGTLRIGFKPTLAGATITLNPNFAQGYGQFRPQGNVFIDGRAWNVTIQRDPATATKHRLFEVRPGLELTLKGLTLRNGDTDAAESGGAVRADGDLTLTDCTFVNNRTAGYGGAVAATGPDKLRVTGTTFTGNHANGGGAVYVNGGTATIGSSHFVLNTATMDGGGIYISEATVTLHATDVNGNRAGDRGGGVYVHDSRLGSTLTLAGGTAVRNNVVTLEDTGKGGGIYFGKGTINLNSVSIGGNRAAYGDGLYLLLGSIRNIGNPGVAWDGNDEYVGTVP